MILSSEKLKSAESYHSLLKYLNADLPRPLNDDEKQRLRVPPRAFSLAPYMNHSSVLRKMVQIGVDLLLERELEFFTDFSGFASQFFVFFAV
jgi:hypothetical protein